MTASDLALQMAELRKRKPRPVAKLYGSAGPTPEQAAQHKRQLAEWQRQYRALSNQHKRQLALDNQTYRATSP